MMRRLDEIARRWVSGAQWIIIVSIGIVVAVGVPMGVEHARDWYDSKFPVWKEVRATNVRHVDGVARFYLSGYKQRGRWCTPLAVDARSSHVEGAYLPATAVRMDKRVVGMALPVGWHSLGEWEVHPATADAISVTLYFTHECANRLVYSPGIEIKLP